MPRTRKPKEYAIRQEAFIDAAERLIRTRGYEQMTIQAVLDEVGASKGAFYHYYDSKEALLQAATERIASAALAVMEPIVADPETRADEKLQRIFLALGAWKAERRELMLGFLDIWRSDANAIVRERIRRLSMATIGRPFAEIVRQGQAEGTFRVDSPEHTGHVLWSLFEGLGDVAIDLLVRWQTGTATIEDIRQAFAAYDRATERVLGLRQGSFHYLDDQTLHVWFD